MSRMLTFHDAAWASARSSAQAGRRADALAALAPLLAGEHGVPERLHLLAHRLAARVHAAAGHYTRARKHLLAAARLDPDNAEIQFELGHAYTNDPYGCDRRAARRFHRAMKLDPRQVRFTAATGRALVRINRVRRGMRFLVEAAEQAPADTAILKVVVEGLCDADRLGTARRIVNKAKFLVPGNAAIRQLDDELRFAQARQSQRRTQREYRLHGPRILPLLRVVDRSQGTIIRRDQHSLPAPHFGRLRAYRNERG